MTTARRSGPEKSNFSGFPKVMPTNDLADVGRSLGRSALSFASIEDLQEWLSRAPAGTTLPAVAVKEVLERVHEAVAPQRGSAPVAVAETWAERLWTVPAETRIGVPELAEALRRPKSWVYRRTAPNSHRAPLPYRKLDNELVFVVGEIRRWLREHETVLDPGKSLAAGGN